MFAIKKMFFLFAIFSLFKFYGFAAAAGTHVFFAQLWLEMGPERDIEEQKAFIVGTLFPDIRYLGTIPRNQTHEKGVKASSIKREKNPFFAGKKLHAFVDEQRQKFVKKTKISLLLKSIPKEKRVLFLKLLEDEIIWNVVHRDLSKEALLTIYPEELAEGATLEIAKKWHSSLTEYFELPPSQFLAKLSREGKGFLKANPETALEWSRSLLSFANDPVFIKYMESLIEELSILFYKDALAYRQSFHGYIGGDCI